MATERASSAFPCLLAAAAVALGGATSCFAADSGQSPPAERIYFPVGIALGPSDCAGSPAGTGGCTGPKRMYVANSDFDLQYNAGTLQVYDLEKLRLKVPHWDPARGRVICDGVGGEQSAADRLLRPGLCNFVDSNQFRITSVQIGAFATDVLYKGDPNPGREGHGRLFVPVRGDTSLHWIDVDDAATGPAALDCGQAATGACDRLHRRGDPSENTRRVDLPVEPFGIAMDEKGEAIVTTHQSDGKVALFVNDWRPGKGPNLQFVATGLPSGALAIAAIPEPAIVSRKPCLIEYQPGFLMTYRNSPEITLVRYFSDKIVAVDPNGDCISPDPAADPARPFLETSRSTVLTTNSQGYNSRGIAIDPTARQACEAKCAEPEASACLATCRTTSIDTATGILDPAKQDLCRADCCLQKCAAVSLDVYLSDRAPPTLILGHTLPNRSATGSDDLASFYANVPVQAGPSRVFVGDVIDTDGSFARRIFVVCFDSRLIYVYDPRAHRFETQIYTGRGPHAFAIDRDRGLGYVGHFTDSYIGVVDLDRRNIETYGKMLLTVGEPRPPRASK